MFGAGYLRDERDERDYRWQGLCGAAPENLPARVSLESVVGPAFDQGQCSECVCYSLAGLKRYQEFVQSGQWLAFDPHDLYSICKQNDGAPTQEGTFPRVALDVLSHQGMLASDGKRYSIDTYARAGTVAEIRHALAFRAPVLIGLHVSSADLGALSAGQILPLPSGFDGGHCMLAVGYDDQLMALRVRNSWSVAWCDDGHFWLPYSYLTQADPGFDAWTTTDGMGAR